MKATINGLSSAQESESQVGRLGRSVIQHVDFGVVERVV